MMATALEIYGGHLGACEAHTCETCGAGEEGEGHSVERDDWHAFAPMPCTCGFAAALAADQSADASAGRLDSSAADVRVLAAVLNRITAMLPASSSDRRDVTREDVARMLREEQGT